MQLQSRIRRLIAVHSLQHHLCVREAGVGVSTVSASALTPATMGSADTSRTAQRSERVLLTCSSSVA